MLNHQTRRLYQVLTPQGVATLHNNQGRRMVPGHPDDAFALLKYRYSTAETMAERVWSLRFGWAAVVVLELPRSVLHTLNSESVAYAAHREYRLPVSELPALSAHLRSPISVVKTVVCQPKDIAFRSALGYVGRTDATQYAHDVPSPTPRGLQTGLP